jgi:hypothetical protein
VSINLQEVATVLRENEGIFAFLSPGKNVTDFFPARNLIFVINLYIPAGKPFVILNNEEVLNDILIRNASK